MSTRSELAEEMLLLLQRLDRLEAELAQLKQAASEKRADAEPHDDRPAVTTGAGDKGSR